MLTTGTPSPLRTKCKTEPTDYRDSSTMPDSPDTKPAMQAGPISPATSLPASTPTSRPLSSTPGVPALNGSHSPLSSMNGRTPSPPAVGNTASSQQLPPACGARQLSKLKRFLTTLQQFGSDISPEIGERVRSLVLGLVNNHLSIEEFHGKLQEATNFPLRPFVIPFLKANLPLLQRELLHCARLAKQSPQQYLAHNEHVLFDPSHSPLESQDSELNENGKRHSPDRPKENGFESSHDSLPPAKRPHTMSPGGSSRISPTTPFNLHSGPIRLEDISLSREMRERERLERERAERERYSRERERHDSYGSNYSYHRQDHFEPERVEDDWKHIENMLHCIVSMVDKTKRALAVLQERSMRDREELAVWMRRQSEGLDSDVKKRTSEMMASTLRQTEDRVSEVKRRAEEAVNEVKRQAVAELQKAVATAESKANELIAAERSKMERTIAELQRKNQEEIQTGMTQQEESSETCWNCGRKASETCSGCNVARYCGSFCQHKDWENHHHVCGQPSAVREIQAARDMRRSTATQPAHASTTAATATVVAIDTRVTSSPPARASPSPPANSPENSTTTSISGSRSSTPAETKAS